VEFEHFINPKKDPEKGGKHEDTPNLTFQKIKYIYPPGQREKGLIPFKVLQDGWSSLAKRKLESNKEEAGYRKITEIKDFFNYRFRDQLQLQKLSLEGITGYFNCAFN